MLQAAIKIQAMLVLFSADDLAALHETIDQSTFGTQGAEVVSDATALLHGESGFLQHLEDAVEAVRDRARCCSH